jgi:hypothetical protein
LLLRSQTVVRKALRVRVSEVVVLLLLLLLVARRRPGQISLIAIGKKGLVRRRIATVYQLMPLLMVMTMVGLLSLVLVLLR